MRRIADGFWCLLILSLFCPLFSVGQLSVSPYSRYGFGDLYRGGNGLTPSLGYSAKGIRTPQYVNIENPASLSAFDLTVFDVGLNAEYMTLRSDTSLLEIPNASFAYLSLGFPIRPWWGTAFGLRPFSTTGYNISQTFNDTLLGQSTAFYRGSGGVNKAFWGHGFSYRRFSAGVNVSYLFGSIVNDRRLVLDPNIANLNTVAIDDNAVGDFDFEFGMQYVQPLDTLKRRNIVIGATYGLRRELNTSRDRFVASYSSLNTSDRITDTILFSSERGKMILPERYGLGLSYTMPRWLIAADWKYARWGDFMSFGIPGSMTNSNEYSLGGQFIPDPGSVGNYLNLMNYRMGFRYNQSQLLLNNRQIQEFGITIGIGMPLRRTRSILNFAFEGGQRGQATEGLIRERYIRFTFGLTLNDRWFVKRRYD
jgi:hypothetical protein